jgi:hypothetical protein
MTCMCACAQHIAQRRIDAASSSNEAIVHSLSAEGCGGAHAGPGYQAGAAAATRCLGGKEGGSAALFTAQLPVPSSHLSLKCIIM